MKPLFKNVTKYTKKTYDEFLAFHKNKYMVLEGSRKNSEKFLAKMIKTNKYSINSNSFQRSSLLSRSSSRLYFASAWLLASAVCSSLPFTF